MSAIDSALARLGAVRANGHPVLSVYLSLDPGEFPHVRDRRIQLDALLARAAQGDGAGQLGGGARAELDRSIEAVRRAMTDDALAPQGARALAVFCSEGAGLLDVVPLAMALDPAVRCAAQPWLEPLLELGPRERWCVLLVSRRDARILLGSRDRLAEAEDLLEDVHGRHDQGGWSQSRYERGIEREVDAHLERTCADLEAIFRRRPFDMLLLGCHEELRTRIENRLGPELRGALQGHFEIDVERATPAEALDRATPLIDAAEARREDEALARLQEGLAPAGHGAAGADEVLALLPEGRVQTLLLRPGLARSGFECPRCGRLLVQEGPCPVDGSQTRPLQDVIGRALEQASATSAEVLFLHHHGDRLDRHEGIAALLRY